jgi:hypothetical protein
MSWYGKTQVAQIEGAARNHKPDSSAEGGKLLLQGAKAIAKQAAYRGGRYYSPPGLLTYEQHGHLAAAQALFKGCTALLPSRSIELEARGNPGAEGIDQSKARGAETVEGAGQGAINLQDVPVRWTPSGVGLNPRQPGSIFGGWLRPGCQVGNRQARLHGEVLGPEALATAGRTKHKSAWLAGINHHHSYCGAWPQKKVKHG